MSSFDDDKMVEMVSLVKEILPQVPAKTIEHDLRITRDIEETLTRLVDDVLFYKPEDVPLIGSSSSSSSSSDKVSNDSKLSSKSSSSLSEALASSTFQTSQAQNGDFVSFNTAAKSFAKTPCERMFSLEDRKKALIEAARQRYIKKHGLNIS